MRCEANLSIINIYSFFLLKKDLYYQSEEQIVKKKKRRYLKKFLLTELRTLKNTSVNDTHLTPVLK